MRYSKTLVMASCVLSLFCFASTSRGATFYTATISQDENAAIWTNDPVGAASLTQQLVGHGVVPSPGNDYVLLYNGTNIDNAGLNLMTYVRSQNLNAFLGDSLTVNSN